MTSEEAKHPQDNWTFGDWMESRVVLLNDNKELVAEVERLREAKEWWTAVNAELLPYQERAIRAEADLAVLREQRCETCQHRYMVRILGIDELQPYCDRHADPCEDFGHRCGAWARREP